MLSLTIIQILQVLLNVVWWVIVVQFVLSLLIVFNVINTGSPFIRSLHDGLDRLTESRGGQMDEPQTPSEPS